MDFQSGTRQPGREFCRAASVEANAFECGSLFDQGGKIVGFSRADVGVERAGPHTGAIDVPDADPVRENALDSFGVGKLVKRFAKNGAKQLPEMILLVPVVLLRRQGGRGGETAQDQAADAGVENRGQAGEPFMRCDDHAVGMFCVCSAWRINLIRDVRFLS